MVLEGLEGQKRHRKMGKPYLKLLLAAMTILLNSMYINAEIYSGICGFVMNYTLNTETGELIITGSGDMSSYSPGEQTCPWISYREFIKNIVVSEGISSIGNWAFYQCTNLASVTLPSSLKSIGNSAFEGCANLESIILPSNLADIGKSAFANCSNLSSINLPSSITRINLGTFSRCTKLESIEISEGVTIIDQQAFADCSSLISIKFPYTLSSIGMQAFVNCSSLKEFTLPRSLTEIGIGAFENCASIVSVDIPDGIKEISHSVFKGCLSLTSITIPKTITTIGTSAFEGCSSLSSIIIPSSVETIYDNAFKGCTNLPVIDNIQYADTYLVSVTDKTLDSYSIKEGTRFLGNESFANCNSIVSIIIPENVSRIGERAFANCRLLKSVKIPERIAYIASTAFDGCYSLPEVNNAKYAGNCLVSSTNKKITSCEILEGTTFIMPRAFINCNKLVSVKIPSSVRVIGSEAFYGCQSLSQIELPHDLTEVEYRTFCGCSNLSSIEIPVGVKNIGSEAFNGCSSLQKVNILSDMLTIGEQSFNNCSNLYDINLPHSLKDIASGAFAGCSSLSSISIPESVEHIGTSAFSGCITLVSIRIPESVKELGYNVFDRCSNLNSITIENGNDSLFINERLYSNEFYSSENIPLQDIYLGRNIVPLKTESGKLFSPFGNTQSLISITIGHCVTKLDLTLFYGCNEISSITFEDGDGDLFLSRGFIGPLQSFQSLYVGRNVELNGRLNIPTSFALTISDRVTSLSGLFAGCEGLEKIEIPESVSSIGMNTFSDCKSLSHLYIPNSVKSIGSRAFSQCSALSSIHLPEQLDRIGPYLFWDCINLCSVEIPNNVSEICYAAFQGCKSLNKVFIPKSVKRMQELAFYDCVSLDSIIFEDGRDTLFFEKQSSDYPHPSFANCPVKYIYLGRNLSSLDVPPFSFGKLDTEISLTIGRSICGINNTDVSSFKKFITSAFIPNNIESIDATTFESCNKLKIIHIEDGDNPLNMDGVTFYNSPITSLYLGRDIANNQESPFVKNREGLRKVTIGPKVSELSDKLFWGHSGLESVKMSEGLKKIGAMAFYGCDGLTELEIPGSVVEISEQAFDLCRGIKKVSILDGAETLNFTTTNPNTLNNSFINSPLEQIYVGRDFNFYETSPFEHSETLSRITLGSKLKSIPSKAFLLCPNLLDVYAYSEDVPKTGDFLFTESYLGNARLHIPEASYKAYHEKSPWNKFGRLFAIVSDVEEKEVFKIVFMLDGETYAEDVELEGNMTSSLESPEREGYTFSGWEGLPEKMPAENVTVTGTFTVNTYNLTYILDDEEYKTISVEYGSDIESEVPERDGYTFSGWEGLPEKMPAENVTVTGTFTINQYTITYIIDGEVFYTESIDYGSKIEPPITPERNGYDFAWEDYPETVPANDVIIYGSYTTGIARIMADRKVAGIYSMDGKRLSRLQRGVNIIRLKDGTVKRVIIKE